MKTTSLVFSWVCLGLGSVLILLNFIPVFTQFAPGIMGAVLIAAAVVSLAIHTASK
jgi:hypothetical protein